MFFFRMSKVLKLILKLSVITTTIICQLNLSLSSRSCVVTKNDTQRGDIEFIGESQEFCYLHIITHSSAVVIEAPSTTSPFYLYVEREDTDRCSNGSYAMINGQAESCYAVFTMFTQNRLQLNLQGNISINLKEIHSMDESVAMYPRCTKSSHDFTENINIRSNVECKLKWYGRVISCEDTDYCRLSFPNKCNASLGYREVELKCMENEEKNQKALLVYPDVKYILDLRGNNIVYIDSSTFHDFSNLKILRLDSNQLQQLPIEVFDNLGDLFGLVLIYNQLTSIDNGMFVNLQNLGVLSIKRNQIKTIGSGCFHNLAKLIVLDLSYNMITSLPTDTFQGLHSLEELYLHEASPNMITLHVPRDLFHNLTQLTLLHLRNNTIIKVETGIFKDLGELVFLFLERNAMTHLYSGIFIGLDNLEILSVSDNQLRWIDADVFHPLLKLKSLSLVSNMLMELNPIWFRGLNNLDALFMGGNIFRMISRELFIGLTKLKLLTLDYNQFDKLDVDIFHETMSLEYLNLAFNRLQNVPNVKFLTKLNYLGIRGNPLLKMKKLTLPNDTVLAASQHEICECFAQTNSTKNTTCSASEPRSPYLTCDRLLADRALVAMMWLIGLNAIGGNVFVLVWKQKHGQKSKVQDLLLSNLALSDLVMGFYMLMIACADVYFGVDFPMYSESWRSGITCRIAGGLSILSSEASVFFVTLISIDRFICIRFPFTTKKLSKRSAFRVTTLIWLFAISSGCRSIQFSRKE